MSEADKQAETALNIMREWEWKRCDPDGIAFDPAMPLNDVIARLAMDGLPMPHDSVLVLLCTGDLIAHGSFRWRKYEAGESYQIEKNCYYIKPMRWQILAQLKAKELEILAENGPMFPDVEIDLEHLGLNNSPVYEWEFGHNRFCTSYIPPNTEPYRSGYYEEWFTAWEIEVWPKFLNDPYVNSTEQHATVSNKGGRPPAANWEAAALEMAGRYYLGDLKPKTVADVTRELNDWLAGQDIHLSESVVRNHAKPIFEAFQKWQTE